MTWVLIFYTVTGTISVHEFKKESDCFYALMRYYPTKYKTDFRCEERNG